MAPTESAGDDVQDDAPTDARESGVDLGRLDEALSDHSYPASTGELLDAFGDYEISLADGSETLTEVLAPMGEETFDDAESVRQAIFTMVGSSAVGRKGYSDRGGASPASDVEGRSDESF